MCKEVKISLAVIVVLLIIFGVVLGRRLTRTADDPPATAAKDKSQTRAKAKSAPKDARSGRKAASAEVIKPTVVPAKAASREIPQRSPKELGQWTVVSDRGTAEGNTIGVRPTAPSPYMPPNPPKPYPDDPLGRYGNTQQSQAAQTSQAWQGSSRTAEQHDPFRNRVPYKDYSAGGSAAQQAPLYRQAARRHYPAPPAPARPARRHDVSDISQNAGRDFGAGNLRDDNGDYQVQPNDNYCTISSKLYGTDAYFKALAEHNRGRVPQENELKVGQLIAAPDVSELERDYPELCPKPSRREIVRSRASTVSLPGEYAGANVYVVEEGDTLFDIARYELGKASRWAEIYELNRDQLGEDYDYLTPGMRLAMPNDGPIERTAQQPAPVPVYRR